MITVGWPLESVLNGCQLTHLPASLKVRCSHVMSFPPVGCQEEVVWALLRLVFKTLRIPFLHSLSPSCPRAQHGGHPAPVLSHP